MRRLLSKHALQTYSGANKGSILFLCCRLLEHEITVGKGKTITVVRAWAWFVDPCVSVRACLCMRTEATRASHDARAANLYMPVWAVMKPTFVNYFPRPVALQSNFCCNTQHFLFVFRSFGCQNESSREGEEFEERENGLQNIKLVLVGEPGVGKTSLAHRVVHNRFSSKYAPTLHPHFSRRRYPIHRTRSRFPVIFVEALRIIKVLFKGDG
jgi:hypothetical protein